MSAYQGSSYNSTQPQNNKNEYQPLDQVDFLIKTSPTREIVANSFRISGILKLSVVVRDASGVETLSDVLPEHCVYLNPFAGVHSCFRSFQSSLGGSIVENNVLYGRYAGVIKQSQNTLENLSCSTRDATELCGVKNNHQLMGEVDQEGVSFSFSPLVALNRSSANLQSTRFNTVRLLTQLSASLECFYTTSEENDLAKAVVSIKYSMSKLLLQWREVPIAQINKNPIICQNIFLNASSIVSKLSNITVQSPNPYDAVFTSFIKQSHMNKINCDNNLSEYVKRINRLEFTINSENAPLNYAISNNGVTDNVYPDIAVNYCKALKCGPKNSIGNLIGSQHWSFGIGCAMVESVNDKITQTMTIDDSATGSDDPSEEPLMAYTYLNSYVSV